MENTVISCTYFAQPGKENTEATLQIARTRAEQLGIRTIIVATTTGQTGVRATEVFKGYRVVAITHVAGFHEPNQQELTETNRQAILANGGHIITTAHAFGGVGRGVRNRLQTYQLDEIIAFVLRMFGQGMKVVCEISLMAADAGAVRVGEPAIAIAGTGGGADTAIVVAPANAHTFLNMKIMEILCKPRLYPEAK